MHPHSAPPARPKPRPTFIVPHRSTVISRTNSIADPTHCDIMIYVHERDARAAIQSVGGDDSISVPEPLRRLVNVKVQDAAALTTKWDPPPWEPPTFRDLKFSRFEASTQLGAGRSPSPQRQYANSTHTEFAWSDWLAESRERRRLRDRGWRTLDFLSASGSSSDRGDPSISSRFRQMLSPSGRKKARRGIYSSRV